MTIPWAYTRRMLAEKWRIPPWEVDRVPHQEIDIELRIMAIEADVQAWRKRHPRGQDEG